MSGADKWLPPLESGAGIAAIAAIARFMKRLRHRRRFGKVEDEKLVTELVERAVATQGVVLEDLRKERIDDRAEIARLEGVSVDQRGRIEKLERKVFELSTENGRLKYELSQVKRQVDGEGSVRPDGDDPG